MPPPVHHKLFALVPLVLHFCCPWSGASPCTCFFFNLFHFYIQVKFLYLSHFSSYCLLYPKLLGSPLSPVLGPELDLLPPLILDFGALQVHHCEFSGVPLGFYGGLVQLNQTLVPWDNLLFSSPAFVFCVGLLLLLLRIDAHLLLQLFIFLCLYLTQLCHHLPVDHHLIGLSQVILCGTSL